MSLARVVGVGARGPLGLTALSVSMGVRAGFREPRACHLLDRRKRAARVCLTGGLGAELYGYDRLVRLGAPALAEAAAPWAGQSLPLLLCLAEAGRPDDDERLQTDLLTDLARESGVAVHARRSELVRTGRAGFGSLLEHARELLDAGAPAVVVGGVDSYYHPEVIRWLDDACRLHAQGAENGIVPSEGGAFCVLAPDRDNRKNGRGEPLARLTHAATARERTVAEEDEPNLARAMTGLLAGLAQDDGPAEWALPDLNGERHRSREWQLAAARGALADDVRVDRLADALGDVGAATGPTLLSVAAIWWQVGCAPADACVVALHSEGTGRSAFRIESARSGEQA